MVVIDIPGFKKLELEHLVLDFNGTMAVDGNLLEGVGERLLSLSKKILIHVVTADTFGNVREEVNALPVTLKALGPTCQDVKKLEYVQNLGADSCVCIGNGRNDRLMLQEAALGVAVLEQEGVFAATSLAADMLARDIRSALDLLRFPQRLIAGLRL
jgi:soluble P-type ATPase